MNRHNLLITCLCISLLLVECRPLKPDQSHRANEPGDASLDRQWRDNLIRWLDVSYVEEADRAAFASVDLRFLRRLNLYTTYGMTGILVTAGENIEDAAAIRDWLFSLQGENGAFDDPLNDLPSLVETYWAISILDNLNTGFPNKDGIVQFVCSLQGTDGFFHPDASLGGSQEEQAIVATAYAVKILLLADTNGTVPCLQKTHATLVSYLQSHLPREFSLKKVQYFIASSTLAQLAPRNIPAVFVSDFEHALAKVPSLSTDPAALSHVTELYNIATSLDLTKTKNVQGNLQQYIVNRLIPVFEDQTGYAWASGPPDPMLTYLTIKLFHGAGIDYPHQSDLLHMFSKYRVRNGWLTIVHPVPDPEATYYALWVAHQIGYVNYDGIRVSAYFRSFVQPHTAPEIDLRDVYFAVQGLAALNQSLEEQPRLALQKMAESKFIRLSNEERDRQILWLVRNAGALEWKLSNTLQEQISQNIHQRSSLLSSYRMRDVYEIFLLQTVSGIRLIPSEQILARVLDLKSDQGGFTTKRTAPSPDIHSTRLALEILLALHSLEKIDRETTKNFVRSCQDDFGFNIVPVSAIAAHPEVYNNLSPDFSSTYDGFRILQILSLQQESSQQRSTYSHKW